MSPAEEIKAAFTKFRSLENWDFESIWPIASTLIVLGLLFISKKWLIKEYKDLKQKEGIKDDDQD